MGRLYNLLKRKQIKFVWKRDKTSSIGFLLILRTREPKTCSCSLLITVIKTPSVNLSTRKGNRKSTVLKMPLSIFSIN